MTFAAGELIGGRYRLEELIGSGGMGDVFRARDTLLERAVALKLVDFGDPRRREEVGRNFLREARISAAIAHRNVVQILDFGTHGDAVPFIVMELLEGESLAQVLGRGERLSFGWIIELVLQLLDGLAAAHDAGVVHRDLKPENIYLVRNKAGDVYPKILDFGISKLTDEGGSARVTTQGHVVGTPAYMSPEQARGVKFIDKRTDLYSMGVVLYELLSGEMPFFSENPGDVMVMIVTKAERPLHERAPEIPLLLSGMVARAMKKRPEDRYSDARDMQSALRAAAEELQGSAALSTIEQRGTAWRQRSQQPTELEPLALPTGPNSSARPDVRRRYLIAGLTIVLAGASVGATMALLGRSQAAPESHFIVVHADRPDEPPPAAQPPVSAVPTIAIEPARVEPRKEPKRVELDPAASLEDSFKRQKKAVVKCVNAHHAEAERTPKLAVRVQLSASGKVASALVQPTSVASTTMGVCIEHAVKAMQFPGQGSPLTFEVPLTARKEE